ncbi:TolB family protein [Maridesulfovibrio frigidus]|uniref:TolB family protein n=1 Tax=Maridesulfovibrio frigidus TaxID=340956 RepID=UPI0004E0C5EA|nr:PD40 domain-containing protein [Maridesulfovibrio frigidus]
MKNTTSKILKILLLAIIAMTIAGCTPKKWTWDSHLSSPESMTKETKFFLQKIVIEGIPSTVTALKITRPVNGAVFPSEIAAPQIIWNDEDPDSRSWFIAFTFENGRAPIYVYSSTTSYEPNRNLWETIKTNSVKAPATISIYGFKNKDGKPVATAASSVNIRTSTDPVDGAILYRQVPLPFKVGVKTFRKLKWRLGDISSYNEPPVILENLNTCANCHQGSKDGSLISMELNYKGDSGAQFIAKVSENISLSDKDFMTWTDYPKSVVLPKTRGLFARLSPSGKYIASTVNEISYSAVTNSGKYSQLFFPTYGILACYSTDTKEIKALPGAASLDYIQTNPAWSPDEKAITFARSETMNKYHEDVFKIKTSFENKNIHELNEQFPVQYDLYTIPFNAGTGGQAKPLKGASNNGKSNYFPRYSPDSKWVVFTQSKTGIMLQPDSELFIVQAKGGVPRKMNCNRTSFNSWHSFSPNGKWMIFSSKVNSEYTEIFMTHIDENGTDSPPVLLSRFSSNKYAANLPEFLNIRPDAIKSIHVSNHN